MTFADTWELDSGFKTEMTFTVDFASFGPHESFGNNLVFSMVGHDEENEVRTQIYSIGADWVTSDGGHTVAHPTKKRFNKTSNFGRFIEAALQVDGLGEYLTNAGPATNADIWNDLVLELKEITIERSGVNRATGEPLKDSRLMVPVGWSKPGAATVPSAPTQSTLTPVSAPSGPHANQRPSPTKEQVLADLKAKQAAASPTDDLRLQLMALAKQHDTHDSFVEAAFDLAAADDDLLQEVIDVNGIYKTAHG